MLCDVVPKETCQVLLRRPFQITKNSMHNGLTNETTLTHEKNRYLFYPLTSSWVLDGQKRLKHKIKTEKSLALLEQKVVSKESSNKKFEQGRKNLEKKIMYSSLKKSCEKLPKTIEKQEEWQLNKTDFCTTAQTNSFALFDDSHGWTSDPRGRA